MRLLYLLAAFGVASALPILGRQDPNDPCIRVQGDQCPEDHPYLHQPGPLATCCTTKPESEDSAETSETVESAE
ncbi:uncharacterized protein ASPGLDRAFT_45085 [Aspergillus glaucus CBS 516.65]|uniref:Long chronological lifespan protein 2 n=1 Tax=Aspergillus glaucus CBS 516.65 TaxID=1160497 RepID=A0A1L9VQA8_ASPGL|nr:hypothetical protein ASPGLDRAFT_45085 [Aspergillus glaucus CBS 516.65]OJJ86070.1 hypothetical protein ASPGLDRAFT_45085 [Aspergillus glaucus CBS 516.65]